MNSRNNPGNLKGNDQWKGRIGQDSRGHVIFDTPEHGFRALLRTLQQKWLAGLTTLEQLFAGEDRDGDGKPDGGWAPADDTVGSIAGNAANDPESYAGWVGRRVGVDAAAELPNPAENPALWLAIARAIDRYETKSETPWPATWEGAALWWRDFVEAKRA